MPSDRDNYRAASQLSDDDLAGELAYQERAVRSGQGSRDVLRMVRAVAEHRETERTAREGLPYIAPRARGRGRR